LCDKEIDINFFFTDKKIMIAQMPNEQFICEKQRNKYAASGRSSEQKEQEILA